MDTQLIFRDLFLFRWSDGVQYAKHIIGFDVCALRVSRRKIRAVLLNQKLKEYGNLGLRFWRVCKARFQEKLLRLDKNRPYRKPTQVVRSRRPRRTSEMSPRNSAKNRPYLRYKACLSQERPQLKNPWRLFIKNTAPCELVRGCIGGDT